MVEEKGGEEEVEVYGVGIEQDAGRAGGMKRGW